MCPVRSPLETTTPNGGPWTNVDVEEELRKASTALHLGAASQRVLEFVEWATTHPALDPGHRQSERSWHCMGQRVLSIRRGGGGISVTGGIHYSGDNAPAPRIVNEHNPLDEAALAAVRAAVEDGIAERSPAARRSGAPTSTGCRPRSGVTSPGPTPMHQRCESGWPRAATHNSSSTSSSARPVTIPPRSPTSPETSPTGWTKPFRGTFKSRGTGTGVPRKPADRSFRCLHGRSCLEWVVR